MSASVRSTQKVLHDSSLDHWVRPSLFITDFYMTVYNLCKDMATYDRSALNDLCLHIQGVPEKEVPTFVFISFNAIHVSTSNLHKTERRLGRAG